MLGVKTSIGGSSCPPKLMEKRHNKKVKYLGKPKDCFKKTVTIMQINKFIPIVFVLICMDNKYYGSIYFET